MSEDPILSIDKLREAAKSPPENPAEDLPEEWKGWWFHVPTVTFGIAQKYFPPGTYTPTGEDKPIGDPVLKFIEGHAFLIRRGVLRRVTKTQVQAFRSYQKTLSELLLKATEILSKTANRTEAETDALETITQLVEGGLRAQLLALRGQRPGVDPEPEQERDQNEPAGPVPEGTFE